MSKSICVLAGAVCPKTSDPTARHFCPHWKDAIPEHTRDGSGRVVAELIYTGCQLPKLIPYLQSVTAEADHAHAAANQARDAAIESRDVSGSLLAHMTRQEELQASLLPLVLQRAPQSALTQAADGLFLTDGDEEQTQGG